MSKKFKQKLLFTPGPLNTSDITKKSFHIDLGSRDKDFIRINKSLFLDILKLGYVNNKSHICIPIQGSGTFCLEATLATLLKKKSKVLILTNGLYGKRLITICKKIKKNYLVLSFNETESISIKKIEKILINNKSISHISVVHCETSSGMLNPLNEISLLSKKYKKKLIVDAMSSFGGIDINIKKNNIDALVSSANKCLEGIPGFSFAIIKKMSLSQSKGNANSLSLDLFDQWKGFLKNNQWRFTPPTHSIIGLSSALEQLKKEGGIKKRNKRYKKNYLTLVNGMKNIGFQFFLDKNLHSPIIVCFKIPKNPKFNFNFFYENLSNSGFVIYPGSITNKKTFRIGCIGNINSRHVFSLLNAIKKTIIKMRIKHLSI